MFHCVFVAADNGPTSSGSNVGNCIWGSPLRKRVLVLIKVENVYFRAYDLHATRGHTVCTRYIIVAFSSGAGDGPVVCGCINSRKRDKERKESEEGKEHLE